jgi:hypothetical protein
MGNLVLNGSSSGQITISPPAVAGTNTVTMPAGTGTALVSSTAIPTAISGTPSSSTFLRGDGTWSAVASSNLQYALFTYTGSTQTWTCPAGVTKVKAYVVGGGGGSTTGIACVSSVGGNGGYGCGIYTVVPGNTYNITVGAGGAGNNASAGASSGGSSSFSTFLSCTGGSGQSSTGSFTNGAATGGNIANNKASQGQQSGGIGPWYGPAIVVGTTSSGTVWTVSTGGQPGTTSGAWGSSGQYGGGGYSGAVLLEYIG